MKKNILYFNILFSFLFFLSGNIIYGQNPCANDGPYLIGSTTGFSIPMSPDTRNISWDVAGGELISTSSNKSTIRVKYSTAGTFSVSVSYAQDGEFKDECWIVKISPNLSAGTIQSGTTAIALNEVFEYSNLVSATPASGGTGADKGIPYEYQWQESTDNINWIKIPGAIDLDCNGSNMNTGTMYFRRQVYDRNQTAYSNVLIIQPLTFKPGIISASMVIKPGETPAQLTGTNASGGNGTFVYQWEYSTDGMKWLAVASATNVNYQPAAINTTTYFRRKCTSGTQTGNSNTVQVLVKNATDLNIPDGSTRNGSAQPETIPSYNQLNSNSFNKVTNYSIFKPGIKSASDLNTLSSQRDFQKAVTYLDGLGRPIQSVAIKAGAENSDLVGVSVYDQFGNDPVQHLAYLSSSSDNTGSFRTDAATQQPAYFKNLTQNQEDYFYNKITDEVSPISRYEQHTMPGKSFTGNNRGTITTSRSSYASENIRIWAIGDNDSDQPYSTGTYTENALKVVMSLNEQNIKESAYYDQLGKLIMTARQADADDEAGQLRTYYVYGSLGEVRYVLAPMINKYCTVNNNWNFTGTEAVKALIELGCKYLYDAKGRVVSVRKPGTAIVEEFVYDNRDRCVFAQNVLQKTKGDWLLYFYDGLNRTIMIATYSNPSATRASLQAMVDQATITSSTARFSNPPVVDLYLDKREGNASYEATQSVTLLPEFESAAGDEFTVTVNSNAASTVENIEVFAPSISLSGYTPIILYYYDTYSANGLRLFNNAFELNAGANLYPAPTQPLTDPSNLVTGTKIKVIGQEQWLTTTYYYDKKGRLLQSLADNITGGTDITSFQYDFNNKLLSQYSVYKNPKSNEKPVLGLQTRYDYDANGNINQVNGRISNNGTITDKVISTYTYDSQGRIKTKQLSDLETLKFSYALDNGLTGINSEYARDKTTDHYFGMELFYDNGFVRKDYTGNITGATWRRKGNPDEWHAYGYTYDNANRLTKADYSQYTSGNWNTSQADYTVAIPAYDENGNIKKMKQQGVQPGNVTTTIDDLTYFYENNQWSNKLQGVTDNQGDKKLGDFKNYQQRTGTIDYTYDEAGNLIKDKNRGVSITYDPLLGKAVQIKLDGTTKSVEYLYDAVGNVLQKKIIDDNTTNVYSYLHGSVFKDNKLLYVPHPDGRIRSSANGTLVYDYFIADDLGNIRTVITDETSILYYKATHEANPNPAPPVPEREIFSFPPTVDNIPPGHKFYDYNGQNRLFVKLNGNDNARKIGTGKTLRVMAGDKVEMGAMYYYQQNTPLNNTPNQLPADIVKQIISVFLGPYSIVPNGKNNLLQSNATGIMLDKDNMANFVGNTQSQNSPSNVPKAYLNYVLFDENFKMVDGSAIRVNSPDAVTPLASSMDIRKNGFLYIYLSNESPTDVFFDDLTIRHTTGHLLQEDSYYPYGLQIAGLSSQALNRLENKQLFNGIEKINDFDLELYDAFYRTMDPQIGRWWQIDPASDDYPDLSPYNVNANNPVNFTDRQGNKVDDWFRNGLSYIWKNTEAASIVVNGQIFNNVGKNLINKVGNNIYVFFGETLVSINQETLFNSGAEFVKDISKMSFSTLQDATRNMYQARMQVQYAALGGALVTDETKDEQRRLSNREALSNLKSVWATEVSGTDPSAISYQFNLIAKSNFLSQRAQAVTESSEGWALLGEVGNELVNAWMSRAALRLKSRTPRLSIREPVPTTVVQPMPAPSAAINGWVEGFCFVEGTLISGVNKAIPIEKVMTGDSVLAYSEEEKKCVKRVVSQVFKKTTTQLTKLCINDTTIIYSTPDHRFYVEGRWIPARDLAPGSIFTSFNNERITLKEKYLIDTTSINVYNFEVSENHNYFVSSSGILVHNDCRAIAKNRWIMRKTWKDLQKFGPNWAQAFVNAMKKGFAMTAKDDNGILALTDTELGKYRGYRFKLKVAKAPNHARILGRMEKGNIIFDRIIYEKY